jgi:hypothetical protein
MDVNEQLRQVYYDPGRVGSLGGAKPLAQATGVKLPTVKRWLTNELTYNLHKPSNKKTLCDQTLSHQRH